MPLSQFHPFIQQWFNSRFDAPTPAQETGWPAIASGRHTLIAAPTGSGKTLAAFLTCIDTLVREGLDGGLTDEIQVVYVSPLKALSNDIYKNLAAPLGEISALAAEAGVEFPEIRTAVRTGDTPPSQRQRMAKMPPHVLITTPESLYILLTSKSGRKALGGVKTLILDEIHAVARDKRGSHLALSVERLCALASGPVTRIGLSATQRPIEETARFLVGNSNILPDGVPDCLIVDSGHARSMDLNVHMPELELGPIATHEIWAETLDAIAAMTQTHAVMLVFANTRRLVERIAHQLSQRLGEEAVAPHHGSLSRSTRLAAEEKLRAGRVKVCVATASLELGIDIGLVDLVCQVGAPRSINLLLQRVGRSGHVVGGTPKGRLFPLTRDELVECAALARAVRKGDLDTLKIPGWPLDVLSQQLVAACAQEEWQEDELFDLCRRAYPYRDLPRQKFDQVVDVLSEGFASRLGNKGAFLHRDGVNHRLKARRGASIAAITSGGAIPDNADYDVIVEPEQAFVGTVNEDFAIESMAGDVFLLGNTPWKIRRVESGRVRVEDAQGQSPTVPFWLGEAPGRTRELSDHVTALREGVSDRLGSPEDARSWVSAETGVDAEACRQLVAYVEEGSRVLGIVPSGRRVVAERFFDDTGGMQLVIHAPFGAGINRAWGMALRKQICRSFDFELQAAATDDGINFSLGPSLSFPLDDVFNYLSSRNAETVLRQAVLQAPMFAVRWRWNASRSLAVLRHAGGRKVPAPLLRMRSDDLLAAVFPAQVECRDNAGFGDVEVPDHPLTFETMRDCLTEAASLEGLQSILASIESGEIQVYAKDTVQPSVFAHQLLNAMPYAFLDNAPLEERRARAVSLRRALPDDARDLSALDTNAIAEEARNAWPRIRDADELHDSLLVLGLLPQRAALQRWASQPADDVQGWFYDLSQAGRAYTLTPPGGEPVWVAAERLSLARSAFPTAALEPALCDRQFPPCQGPDPAIVADAVLFVIRGWTACSGPLTTPELAGILQLTPADVEYAISQLENEGTVLRGSFTPGRAGQEFCDRRILARIHRSTIEGLRSQVQPVSPGEFLRFLFRWQYAAPNHRLHGEGGVLDVVDMLQGFELAAGAWEQEVLPARIVEYRPRILDDICLSGEVVWGRFSDRRDNGHFPPGRNSLTRSTPISIAHRESLPWLLGDRAGSGSDLSGGPEELLQVLSQRGASFLSELISATGRLSSDVEEVLWQLAAAGRITADSMEPLRLRIAGKSAGRISRRHHRTNGASSAKVPPLHLNGRRESLPRRRLPRAAYSRWWLFDLENVDSDAVQLRAQQLLLRYGILFPELLHREPIAPPWRVLVQVLRRLEARGEISGGRFVSGLVGEQFALPEAVDALRSSRKEGFSGNLIVLSACDPLNLVGILTPGARVPAVLGNRIVFCDGLPVCSLENGNFVSRWEGDHSVLDRARDLLMPGLNVNYTVEAAL